MSGFSPEWLALREPVDRAARSTHVLNATRKAFATHAGKETGITICDLGSGTGASVAAFSSLFPTPQAWHLIDNDPNNLQHAEARYAGKNAIADISIQTHEHDLSKNPACWPDGTDLVIATALFDLASPSWIEALCDRLAADRIPLLATLTYDGRLDVEPELPLDQEMVEAFNRHQRTDKGFGPAAGPEAAHTLVERLSKHRYDITTADSPWELDGDADREMIDALLAGWAGAARELNVCQERDLSQWLNQRKACTIQMRVGHLDLFAAPAVP